MSEEHAQAERRRGSAAEGSEIVAQYPTIGLTQTELYRRSARI